MGRALRPTPVTAGCERCGSEVPQPKRGPIGRFCSATCRKAAHKAQKAGNPLARSGGGLPADSCPAGPEAGGGVESAVPAQPVAGLAENPSPSGLVICAKTAREFEEPQVSPLLMDDDFIRQFWNPRFPTTDLLGQSADMFDHGRLPIWDGSEGPRWRVDVAPGVLAVRSSDRARRERTAERAVQAQTQRRQMLAAYYAEHGQFPSDAQPTRSITSWSRASRSNMIEVYLQLDYAPMFMDLSRIPAMWTLTYPGNWLVVAPSGRAVRRHLRAFLWRYTRAWGYSVVGLWKLEFQRRGAPHVHIFAPVPHGLAKKSRAVGAGLPFPQWLSVVWADIVEHPDPKERAKHERAGTGVDYAEGLRSNDPRRVAVYFTKHGSFSAKEYQNCVPVEWQEPGKGPGRFWGYWGLKRVSVAVELEPMVAVAAARVLRRWARAQGTTREVTVARTQGGVVRQEQAEVRGLAGAQLAGAPGRVRRRKVRRRVKRLASGRGFVAVNDGAEFASQLARAIGVPVVESAADRRARLVAATGSIRQRQVFAQVSVG